MNPRRYPDPAPRRPTVLIILDGYGINPAKRNNAVYLADTPRFDEYFSHYPHTTLQASGAAVGVADGQMGNSEIGHMTLGAGAILRQDSTRIDDAITCGDFQHNPAFLDAISKAKSRRRPLHLLGLVSDGGVHSSLAHLITLLQMCKKNGVRPMLHMITDGRDTAPRSAMEFLHKIEPPLYDCGGVIATLMGRYYAMDRDKRWDRVELAWRAMVMGKGQKTLSAATTICSAYAAGDTDEFIRPAVLDNWQAPQADDPMICFNFRKDRPREIVSALAGALFSGFDRGAAPLFDMTTMMPYDSSFPYPHAFTPELPRITLAEIISNSGVPQLHCAETEKYAHVTYFFNGGRQELLPGEKHLMVPSPNVATYDLKPSMSADKVAAAVIEAVHSRHYGLIVVNFANGDMVGHTAKIDAVIEAVEALDREVGKVLDAAVAQNYAVILTADHGNCEELVDPVTGEPHTQHTLYPVPCLIVDEYQWRLSSSGGLANIAPTILQLMGIEKPPMMAAGSLLIAASDKRCAHYVVGSSLRGAA